MNESKADIALTEAELAMRFKARAGELLEPLAQLLDDAKKHGLLVPWDGIATDFLGRIFFTNLRVEKHY